MQPDHDPVPGDLRDDRGRGHARRHHVALLDRRARDTASAAPGTRRSGRSRARGRAPGRPAAAARCSTDGGPGCRSAPGLGLRDRDDARGHDPLVLARPAAWRSAASSRGSRSVSKPAGRITAAATSGPASAPRPASSAPAMRREPLGAQRALVAVEVAVTPLQPSPPRRRPHDHERLPDHRVLRHVARRPPAARTASRRSAADCLPARTACHRARSVARSGGYPSLGFRYGSSTGAPLTKSIAVVGSRPRRPGKPDRPA